MLYELLVHLIPPLIIILQLAKVLLTQGHSLWPLV
ncbi:hypothetical protein PSHT_05235 [Puccinia striiformis]|uniref:Uncharacterized protein n=2 Tax=Puccinia striiformis TaxID=27350 RepID=A0A2S4WAX5_9BASI|nr:hypothetical protein PSTT_08179 [Puccinia striiformis]POW18912.1 hypothetical protein PSHT_05235 [Puccinia striiformis]